MPSSSCLICGALLPPHSGRGRKRKICDNPGCRRTYKTHKQREYDAALTPAQRDARRQRASARETVRRTTGRRRGNRNSWEWNLKHVHDMTPEQWHSLFTTQGGLCYLCQRCLPDNRRQIVVDHDHSHCGVNRSCRLCRRGLACSNCNTVVGLADEDPARLRVIARNFELQAEMTRAAIADATQQEALF